MTEFHVVMKNGEAWVYADKWSVNGDTVYFYRDGAIVNTQYHVISVQAEGHALHVLEAEAE